MFNFASKMLNTIMGTEEQQGQQGPGQGPYGGMSAPGQPRPMSGFPQVRPSPPQPGGQRPYGPSPPSFTGPRPSPGLARSAPPNFGGMARPMGAPGPGTPHRFNQGPPPQQQSMQGMMPPRGMMPPGSQLGPRGPGPPGQMQPLSPMPMRQRGPQPRQSFQQKVQPQLQLAGGGGSTGVPGAPAPDLDLSHLSAEERAMIENVMAKAQQLEQDAPPAPVPQSSSLGQPGPSRMMRPEDQRASGYEGDFGGGRLCPLCRQRDLSGRDGHLAQECAECGTLVCNRCGGLATHPETKRPEFTCGNCIKRRRAGVNAPGQPTQGGVRQMGPSPFSQQQPSNMEWENGRRGSGGSTGGMAGRAQQRWENDRIQGSMGDCGIPRRRMGGESGSGLGGGTMPLDQRQGIRPQLRPQRSLDNRLPSMSNQPQPDMNQMDRQGNISYSNNNVNNTQLQNQMANAEVQEMIAQTSIASLTAQHPPSQQPPGAMGPMSSSLNTQPYQEQQQPTYSSMVGPEQHQQMEIGPAGLQRPTHQAQQHMQKTVDNLSEWNNNMNAGDHSGAGHMGMSNLDPNMPVSSQQSFQQQQLASNIYGQAQPQFQMGQLQQPDLQPHQQDPQLNHQHLLGQPQQPLQQPFQTQQQQQQNFQNQQFPPQQTTQPVQQSPQQFQTPQSQFQAQPLTQTQTTAPTQFQTQQQQQLHQQQLQAQQLHEQQLQAQQLQQQMQPPSSQQQQQLGSIPCGVQGASSAYSNQQWSQQQQPQQPPLFDQSGRSISSPSTSQFPQAPQYQGLQAQQQSTPHSMAQQHFTGQQHLNIITTQAGPAGPNKSISGLLADFSRALGLGASPRPSPSDEKSEMFLHSTEQQHGQMLSPYEQYLQQQQQQHPPGGAMQQMTHPPLHGSQQQILPSAFASIQDPNQMYVQQQQKQTQQQIHQQQYPYSQQSQMSMQQNVQPSLQQVGNPAQSYAAAQQQFLQANIPNHQQTQVMTQAGIMTQQQAASLGVGVVGALSPAQANMYQQQMALQHQAQHMKKSRRAHLTGSAGELRRDGSSTVYIGGQGLQVSPGGMTIGALTPAVVTSLGTFIGGGPTLIGTSLLQQQLSDPVGTPRSGRDAGDSSDTMSETDSQKSLRMRRKLPCLPPDQEAAPLPSTKKRERQRAQETFSRSLSPMRMSSFDTNMSRTYPMSNFGLSRPSASESNLRKISGMGISDQIPRPGSALGLLQGSSVVSNLASKSDTVYPLSGSMFSTSSLFPGMRLRAGNTGFPTGTDMTTTTSVLSGLYPSYKASDEWTSNLAELAACLPPDLRHLLNKGDTDLSSLGMSGMSNLTSGLGETNLNVGSHLPTYMRTLREQLQEERRQLLSDERRRLEALRERDRELGARLDAVTSRAGSERSRNVGMSRSAGASPVISRKVKGHRRQLSDPKLSLPFSPIQEDGDHELQDFDRGAAGVLRGSQYKSLEYESLEDSDLLRPVSGVGEFGWDPSQSYLASSWAAAGGVLRETAINSMGMVSDEDELRYRSSSRFMPRRSSEGEAWSLLSSSRTQSLTRDKRHQVRKHRKSRSWHPSPYVSEEEEEEEEENINREEKKARIKAEIARRRQQIQERAGIHQELMRMSRVRDGTEHDQHSVLKSVDQLIRDQYGQRQFDPHAVANSRHAMLFGRDKYGPGGSVSSGVISPCASEEDRSIERIASTFRNDDYTNLLYDRLGEMSPLATDSESMGSEMASTPAAMPILPDMPTTYRDRSRRLLEDIGRTDGAHHHHHHHHQRHREGPGSNLKGKYNVSNQGLSLPFRTVL